MAERTSDIRVLGEDLDPYRVQVVYPWNRRWKRRSDGRGWILPHPLWARTWQVEWSDCTWAARGWTRSGALRRARRWYAKGGRPGWQIAVHRWIRDNVTRREGRGD